MGEPTELVLALNYLRYGQRSWHPAWQTLISDYIAQLEVRTERAKQWRTERDLDATAWAEQMCKMRDRALYAEAENRILKQKLAELGVDEVIIPCTSEPDRSG